MAPTPYKPHNTPMRPMEPLPQEPKMRNWNQMQNFDSKMVRHPNDHNLYNMEAQYHNNLPYARYGNLDPKRHGTLNVNVNMEPVVRVKSPRALEPKMRDFSEVKKTKSYGNPKGDARVDVVGVKGGGGGNFGSGGGVENGYAAEEPISRTYQYRKVMKPMLERKRRARINRCLDELKELMVTALQSEGENVSKLEKADILELTVRHLHNLKRNQLLVLSPNPEPANYAERFRAGFTQCAQEVTQFITAPAEVVDPVAGRKLLQHLGACVRQLECLSGQQMELNSSSASPAGRASKSEVKGPMWRPW